MKVYIYGAGLVGLAVLKRFEQLSINNSIIGIIDKNKTGEIQGIPILKVENCRKEYPVIIAIKKGYVVDEVIKELRQKGFYKLYWYRGEVLSTDLESFFTEECYDLYGYSGLRIEHLEVHVSNGCNLNCKGCTHYAPLFKPDDFPQITEVLEDIKTVTQKIDLIETLILMGGEPFLNPQIGEYAIEVRKILRHSTIVVATNGLLIEKVSEENLRKLAEANVLVSVTTYPPTREKMKNIEKILCAYNIRWEERCHVDSNEFNLPLTTNKKTMLKHLCMSGDCLNIWHGRIARCPTLMYIGKLNEVFDKKFPEEGIKYINELDGKEIMSLSSSEIELCKYCVKNTIRWSRCGIKRQESDFMTNH